MSFFQIADRVAESLGEELDLRSRNRERRRKKEVIAAPAVD